jgi:NAD(P)-dependent dehydrogenase (short-subunit alcohol dehydrogenase family)
MKANSIYAGTKGALIAFSKALALELAPQKIRVNCILPGLVRTPMVEKTVLGEHLAEHEKSYPLKFGRPEDIGYAAEFLLSEKARWITGTSMVVDGGFTAY